MVATALREAPVEFQEDKDTYTIRLLRIAASAKDAKANGGGNLTSMTREERSKVLFG